MKWPNCMGKSPAAVARAGDGEEADGRGARGVVPVPKPGHTLIVVVGAHATVGICQNP